MAEWAAVLTGGEGTRLKSVTSHFEADDRPKQFCRLLGERTLLEDTRARTAANIAPERTVLVLTARHRQFYASEVANLPASLVIEQPSNRGTAPAIAYAIGRIGRLDRDAIVAVLPSDHAYLDTSEVQRALNVGFETAHRHRERLVLIGATANRPESEYGWIVPGAAIGDAPAGVFAVERFSEKPGAEAAQRLLASGCFWNTFITIATIAAFRASLRNSAPTLDAFVETLLAAGDGSHESDLAASWYGSLPSVCYSSAVLASTPQSSLVVEMSGTGWIDVGHPERLAQARQQLGLAGRSSRAS